MKKIPLFITWLFSFFPASAVETYITFNPANCLSCVSGIYRICKEDKITSVQLIVKDEYKNDINELNRLYEFNKFPKISLVFSDSMYKALSRLEYDAELIIFDRQKELYRRNVKQVVVNKQLLAYYAAPVHDKSFCSPFTSRMAGFDIVDNYLVLSGKYFDYHVINIETGEEKPVRLTDSIVVDLYKLLYKDSFSKRYPVIQEMISETPTYKPTITEIVGWDKEHLLIHGNIKDYKYNKTGDTVFMLNRPYAMKYKYSTGKVTGVYPLDNTTPPDFDLWWFHTTGNKYYAQGRDKRKKMFQLIELIPNEKTKSLSLKRDMNVTQPPGYKQRKVSPLEEYNFRMKGNLLAFLYDDKITLMNSGKQITIPFNNYATSRWNTYEIRDLYEDKGYYYVLYFHNKEVHIMRLAKENLTASDIVAADASSIETSKIKFYNAGDKIIYQPKGNECFIIKQVKFP